jgi:hypothetical protein
MEETAAFIRLLNNPFKFRFFLFTKIPSAFFAGVRVREIDETHSIVSIPYKWFSQNPFKSTYFACLGMAAEMSTGVLAMSHVYKREPPLSMLVVGLEANYFKKATGITNFRCTDGLAIQTAIEQSIATGEAQMIRARSLGTNIKGEPVAEFFITWSFKVKTKSII